MLQDREITACEGWMLVLFYAVFLVQLAMTI
jgi:hypothetical protein